MSDDVPQPAPAGFHHVTMMITDVSEMELFRDKQQLMAIISGKMDREAAQKTVDILQKQLDEREVGHYTISWLGRFT